MAYQELIKNFERIRDYMREFYVYGFKSREEYDKKSARSYDDERRRVESWLSLYMRFRRTTSGKNVFLAIDSRVQNHNPLYQAWKAKSFTDGDITLHFLLMDLLSDSEPQKLSEIMAKLDGMLSMFSAPKTFDESTIRKKLKEYEQEGIVETEKVGKIVTYRRAKMNDLPSYELLHFFSEAAPLGAIGSFLLDKKDEKSNLFRFKHHYITGTFDSDILLTLFRAIREEKEVTLIIAKRRRMKQTQNGMSNQAQNETPENPLQNVLPETMIPLQIRISVQNGRQYLMAYAKRFRRYSPIRIDAITSVTVGEKAEEFRSCREKLKEMEPHMWGVSTRGTGSKRLETISFTVTFSNAELYIYERLLRERRCGTVERIGENEARFTATVYDARELVPWIRSFLCRISRLSCTNEKLQKSFFQDLERMYEMYGVGGEDVSGDL